MRAKGFPASVLLVIITASTGCDNVDFEGLRVELRPPAAAEGAEVEVVEEVEPGLEPLELGPLVYLVQRDGPASASAVPVAELRDGAYHELPDPEETPRLVERFGVGRWGPGTELLLLSQGARAGTFVADGQIAADDGTCRLRPRGSGYLELHPGASGEEWFLAVAKGDLEEPLVSEAFPGLSENAALRAASVDVAQRLIPQLGVPWPPSVPGIRRDLRPFTLEDGELAFAASFVYDDELQIGPTTALAYSLFVLAEEGTDRYEPVLTWYQRADAAKAFPRFLGLYDLRGTGSPDVLLEVFGEEGRWLTVVGRTNGAWEALYVDGCGIPPQPDALRAFP